MSRKKIALITIGQSPRPEVVADFIKIWGDSFDIIESGALDNLTVQQIAELEPQPGEAELLTKLTDGQVVSVSHQRLLPYVQQAIARAAAQEADIAIMLCTGNFDGLETVIPLLQPNRILAGSVAGMIATGVDIVVIVPTAGQVEEARSRWQERGFNVTHVSVISPFAKQDNVLESLLNDTIIQNSAAIVVDCFGFDVDFKNVLDRHYHKPIFIPRLLLGQLLLAAL